MLEQVVGIGEYIVVTESGTALVTYSLGSCVAVAGWDPQSRIGGLVHMMLPASSINPVLASSEPTLFVDTGLHEFLSSLAARGADLRTLVLKAAGGGDLLGSDGLFDIGRRNQMAIHHVLLAEGLSLAASDLGGNQARSMRLDVETGTVTVWRGREEVVL